jgi:hypothetical protein
LGGRVYRGCEHVWVRVHLFGVLLHFYKQVLQKIDVGKGSMRYEQGPPLPPGKFSKKLFNKNAIKYKTEKPLEILYKRLPLNFYNIEHTTQTILLFFTNMQKSSLVHP